MNFKKKKPHLENKRKEVDWGSPKEFHQTRDNFKQHDLSVANENG